MNIVKTVDRSLTESELNTIQTFARLTGTACFAYLQTQVFAILPPLAETCVNDLVSLVKERMESIEDDVSYTRFYMPEEHVMVGIPGGICALSDGESEGEPASMLMLRHMCIDACREKQLTAIVFNYE